MEQLVLCTVPLQSLLYWLSKPKSPNLVEAPVSVEDTDTALPYRALAIAVTRKMLYGKGLLLVGVGLVYKPPYLPTVPFSAAYMSLNEWNSAVSNEESENRLEGPRLLFVHLSKTSGIIPVAASHPVMLDVLSKEAVIDIEESVSPLSLRGFRLHTLFTQLPKGIKIHQVAFPHLKVGSNLALVTCLRRISSLRT